MTKMRCWAWAFVLAFVVWPSPRVGAAPRCYPTERFKVIDDQWVHDTLTNLVWQRQSSAMTMTWAAARTYCADEGLRMPTVKELFSIVDLSVAQSYMDLSVAEPWVDLGPAQPYIDNKAFPNTPAEPFWTSTRSAQSCDAAWSVNFGDGFWYRADGGRNTYRARCVRR